MKTYNELKLAQELIRFPTVKTEDKGIIRFLSKKLTTIGFKCTIIKSKGTGPKPALNGGIFQLLRFATTSECPKKFIWGLDFPNLAYRFNAGFGPVPFDLIIVHLKPMAESLLDKNFIIPLSSVLTVGNLISSWANFISL